MNIHQLKRKSLDCLKGRYGLAIAVIFVPYLFQIIDIGKRIKVHNGRFSFIFFNVQGILFSILATCLFIGKSFFLVNLASNKEKANLSNLLYGFKIFFKSLGLNIILNIIFICQLILGIGILNMLERSTQIVNIVVISISLIIIICTWIGISLADLILAYNTEIGVKQALSQSMKIIKENLKDYILVLLSFTWWILGIVALIFIERACMKFFNISSLDWIIYLTIITTFSLLMPYVQIMITNFYLEVVK